MEPLAHENIELTSDQRRRLGAVYQLILSWRRDSVLRQPGDDEQPSQVFEPESHPSSITQPEDSEVRCD